MNMIGLKFIFLREWYEDGLSEHNICRDSLIGEGKGRGVGGWTGEWGEDGGQGERGGVAAGARENPWPWLAVVFFRQIAVTFKQLLLLGHPWFALKIYLSNYTIYRWISHEWNLNSHKWIWFSLFCNSISNIWSLFHFYEIEICISEFKFPSFENGCQIGDIEFPTFENWTLTNEFEYHNNEFILHKNEPFFNNMNSEIKFLNLNLNQMKFFFIS